MAKPDSPDRSKDEMHEKFTWVVKLLLSAGLIYLVLTNCGKSTIGETLMLGHSSGSGGTFENILVIIFVGIYLIALVKNTYRKFSNKPKTKHSIFGRRGTIAGKNGLKK